MSVLTEKQIKYGFNYYHNDDAHPKSVVTVSEYTGEKELVINCTQLEDTYSSRDKKRILIALPKLKYDTLVTRPYLYNDSEPITHPPNTSPN